MSNTDIIRAWKDEAFRESLKDPSIPEHPAGQIELTDASLSGIRGGQAEMKTGVYYSHCCDITETCDLFCTENCSNNCTSDAYCQP